MIKLFANNNINFVILKMNSSLPTCTFCTFINAPDSKICLICKKSLHLPAVADVNYSKIKACPKCFFFNESCDNVCQICGAGLAKIPPSKQEIRVTDAATSSNSPQIRICNDCSYHNDFRDTACQMCGTLLVGVPIPTSQQGTNDLGNMCSMCGKSLQISEENQIKICKTCTYHNPADATKCSICKTFLSRQKEVSNKVCSYCNHDNAPGVECTQCTFMNAIGFFHCAMCEKPLQSFNNSMDDESTDEEIDPIDGDSSDNDTIDEENTDNDIKQDEDKDISTDPMEDGIVEDIGDVEPTSTSTQTVDSNIPAYEVSRDSFEMLESAPQSHKYYLVKTQTNSAKFMRAISTNIEILKTSVPPGIWIKAYEDRMDLLTFMIEGPSQTPYENGLFVFDICLPHDFPSHPPKAHYISFWYDRLNPNLYVNGKVCVSLLGTWVAQRKEEQWGPKSTLLQLIVSIQGLILVEQPYFNEPGYAHLSGTTLGKEGSESYNRTVIIGMIDSTTALIANPPLVFKTEILLHFSKCGQKMYQRLKKSVSKGRLNTGSTNLENFRLAIENISK